MHKTYPAPIQKDIKTAEIPIESPKNAPRPSINLISPKPISLPLEKNQIKRKGRGIKIAEYKIGKGGL